MGDKWRSLQSINLTTISPQSTRRWVVGKNTQTLSFGRINIIITLGSLFFDLQSMFAIS